MHPNAALVEEFYTAFAAGDAERMAACYHDDVVFSDPVFPSLRGEEARDMWRMLCANPKSGLRVEHRDVVADDRNGSAHWEARYRFTTGKPVHNVITATFEFADGKIVQHTDRFDFPRWAGQALGIPGKLLGRTPFLRRKVKAMAAGRLRAFRAER